MSAFVADTAFAVSTSAVIGLAATSFTMQYAVSGVINLAAGEFLTLGAYLTYAINHYAHINIWIGAVVAVLVVGFAGVAMNRFLLAPLSKRGTNLYGLMIVTFGVSIVVQNLITAIFGPASFTLNFGGQERGLSVGSFVLTDAELVTIGVCIVTMVVLELVLHRSLWGRAMRAVVDSAVLARASGINTSFISNGAWFVCGCMGATAGLALAISTGSVDNQLGYSYLLYFMPAAFFGGLGSVSGALTGAVVIAFATSWSTLLVGPEYQIVFALLLLLVVILIKPTGILSRGTLGVGT